MGLLLESLNNFERVDHSKFAKSSEVVLVEDDFSLDDEFEGVKREVELFADGLFELVEAMHAVEPEDFLLLLRLVHHRNLPGD